MRILDTFRSAWAGFSRSRVRAALTVVAIALAAFTITITLALGAGVNTYLDRQVVSVGASDAITVLIDSGESDGPTRYDPSQVGMDGSTFETLSSEQIDSVRQIAGVTSVDPFEHSQPAFIQGDGDQYLLTTQALVAGQQLDIVEGNLPTGVDMPEIAITTSYQEPLGCATAVDCVGRTVEIGVMSPTGEVGSISTRVSAVINDSLIGSGRLWVNTVLQSAITEVAIPAGNPAGGHYLGAIAYATSDDPEVISDIKVSLEDLGLVGNTLEDEIGVFADLLTIASLVLAGFGVIALIAASFGVVNTLFMSVQDRTREIGILKAHGLGAGRIFGLFSLEALLIGFFGSVLGVGAAYLAGQAINAQASATVLEPFPGFVLLQYPVWIVAGVTVLILLITFLAGALPARRAAGLDPITSLRYE